MQDTSHLFHDLRVLVYQNTILQTEKFIGAQLNSSPQSQDLKVHQNKELILL